MSVDTAPPLADVIPPVAAIRQRLAVVATEAHLLRRLLKLAQRREREAERLARLGRPEGGAHA